MVSLNSTVQIQDNLAAVVDESLEIDDITLTNCDREPIHIPNAIQPHGVLVVFHLKTLEIIQVSANIELWIDAPAQSLQGKALDALLTDETIQSIADQIQNQRLNRSLCLPLKPGIGNPASRFMARIHSRDGYGSLELEPTEHNSTLDFFQFSDLIQAPIERLQRTETLGQLCQTAVQEVQAITAFDRVMVYRFHPDGSGSVIAEAARDDAVPYLGLRYPSTDIPQQAKQLYTLNWLRMIPTVDYEPVPIVSCAKTAPEDPLDMSDVGLRSVSSMHIEYLQNMGVQASLSISLMRDNQLWGLIACHHNTPKIIDAPLRTCCEFIGQIMSSELAAKERNEVLARQLRQKSVLKALSESISQSDKLSDGLVAAPQVLLELVNATGAAFIEQETIQLIGKTPTIGQVQRLLKELEPHLRHDSVYSTNHLTQIFPDAESFKDEATGVLGLSISRSQNIYLLWFRPELPQQIDWAGNPHKPESVDDEGQLYLTPRESFKRWVETVLLSSEPWTAAEIEMALELRSAIIGLVLQKADELAQVNLELARSNSELSAFAYVTSHDLKAPLRAIANLAAWIREDLEGQIPQENQEQLDLMQSRIYRMDEMINGLLQYSRVGQKKSLPVPVSIPELLRETFDSLAPPNTIEIKIPQDMPPYTTNKTLLQQVLTNLLSNAIKYIGRSDGRIEVAVQDHNNQLQFEVMDNGPGIETQYHDKIFQMFQTLHSRDEVESTGIGLAIVKKVVENQGGEIRLVSAPGEGSTFIFTWPYADGI